MRTRYRCGDTPSRPVVAGGGGGGVVAVEMGWKEDADSVTAVHSGFFRDRKNML